MIDPALLAALQQVRDQVRDLLRPLDEDTLRTQYHPQLSPLGWHLGHTAWTEAYWLQAVAGGDQRRTAPLAALYNPAESPKDTRGARLPAAAILHDQARQLQADNDALLAAPPRQLATHPLLEDDYLLHFLVQHYSQHYETMQMVLAQRALQDAGTQGHAAPLQPAAPVTDAIAIEAGHYRVGGIEPTGYDNELPAQHVTLEPYRIATRPLSNANYLAFMQDGGYARRELWSTDGWQWLQQATPAAPDHWRSDDTGEWVGITPEGACTLAADDPVQGISWYEASACARWAGGRLPHEHEWEVARRMQHLQADGQAWEWCANTLFPYDGFRAFPYDGYSTPWFDGNHYCLRGGSRHTRPAIRRASFRNFYPPAVRHVFAGLRLAYDDGSDRHG